MSERKYRQSGYQESSQRSQPDRRSGNRTPPRNDSPRGPWGRGLGKPTATVFRCAVCGARQNASAVAADAVCTSCGNDLHTCTHCAHFNPAARWECRQAIEVRVSGKASRNTCPQFTAKASQEFDTGPRNAADAKSAFDALFKI